MADPELVKRMLGAILQTQRSGVSAARLQTEYRELTGDFIPLTQLGHSSLSALLEALPSTVRAESTQAGEVLYFASGVGPKGNMAKVVARQRSSKKKGRAHLVNAEMRVKPDNPLGINAKPQTSLRQPSHHRSRGRGGGGRGERGSRGGGQGGRGRDGAQDRGTNQHNTAQRRGQAHGDKPEKRMTLPSRFHKEVQAHLSRNSPQTGSPVSAVDRGQPYSPQLVQRRLRDILAKYSNGFWVSKLPQIYKELYKEELPPTALRELDTWTHICTVEKTCSTSPSELLLYPADEQSASPDSDSPSPSPPSPSPAPQSLSPSPQSPSPPSSPAALSPELQARLEELLLKYSNGLWAHALPKLYQDTYKTKLPGHVLENLHLLSHICTIDYPMSDNPKRAILYRRSSGRGDRGGSELKEESRGPEVPSLLPPSEEHLSVLLAEAPATDTNTVVLRYLGESYHKAQEQMEDEMRRFYSSEQSTAVSPQLEQLVAVKEEEEVLRGRVTQLLQDKVKVYYVDHGYSEVISKTKVYDLNKKFFRLPFQATKCRLAGLELFCQETAVLKAFESLACGRILLAEILERGERPLVVLYDTSQDDDVNINTACVKAMQDRSLASPLQVNSVYMSVTVTSVSSDGTLFCQLPSRGLHKLKNLLDSIDTFFQSQVTSEFLVSLPFCGKRCLARYKGKWSRVEITNLHGSRVLDILFIDLGVQASVEVLELREVPQTFLRDLLTIPAQAVRCCLSDLSVSVGSWTPEAVQWLRERVLHLSDCSIKVAKVDETKGCVHVHLFTDKNFHDATRSLNHQMAQSQLFKQHPDVILTSHSQTKSPASPSKPPSASDSANVSSGPASASPVSSPEKTLVRKPSAPMEMSSTQLPPLIELPPPGHNVDVYVSVACHPGHFVLQPWRDMYKLVVLMGEMILFYSRSQAQQLSVSRGQVYAAKVDNNWYRVLVKGVLSNGLVSVYQLDYGKHELVSNTQLRALVPDFTQLPFQALTAQLAGVKQQQWSEEASIVFRNHVERKALVAQLDVLQEAPEPWERRLSVYLVDTSQEERDVWVHDIMAEFSEEGGPDS